jgi:hypothetical protein
MREERWLGSAHMRQPVTRPARTTKEPAVFPPGPTDEVDVNASQDLRQTPSIEVAKIPDPALNEPPRVCRRLPFLREWSNEQAKDKTALFA